jgi:AbrB family looped-hinge helix DNA binding protein
MEDMTYTRLGDDGRLVIPATYRKALGLQPGEELVIRLSGAELHLWSVRQSITRAQELVRRYIPEGVDLVGELLRDRREDAGRE